MVRGGRGTLAGMPYFSTERQRERAASIPEIRYPAELPVSARRDDIAQAIAENQVVIVAGETGSGKTTQLPKICLELGRGVAGLIGHTQPRRIAARSVAERISSELKVELGEQVGYQVRFTEEVSSATLVKVMTDGIMLAEIQSDPQLRRYDTIIIDEAHERSLNIDFLLGYLTRLLPQRPDLKLIITSATIDSERFADHFAEATGKPVPVIEVSGRTYPVEIRYRPLVRSEGEIEEPIDQVTGICEAAEELMAEGPGDILVFLAGEADIRDADAALRDLLAERYLPAGQKRARQAGAVEVLPLYARLSAAEQHRIFQPHSHRRIVLATNVAETSLTVPGIRYVIDPGNARISRFSTRTKVQRLPIEPVSQASANQRSGRCGRVADGIAIRLYSEEGFAARPEFTEPEILRTSLASVILQMASLGLGTVADFPFIDRPEAKAVRDGVQLLTEIGALADGPAGTPMRLTGVGKKLARLPIDPRLGRMILEAKERGCASEIVVIVAALSCQDVRERPTEKREAADELHLRFTEPTSDFLAYLNLWRYLRTQQRLLSSSAFRRMCRAEFLNYLRFREWQDVVRQLNQLSRPLGLRLRALDLPDNQAVIEAGGQVAQACARMTAKSHQAEAIHRSLLVGLLSNIGTWSEQKRTYLGARGTSFVIWPGSGLAKKRYDWVMAAELVETSALFARTVARIEETWIEDAARHLVKRQYSEPVWSAKRGAAMVHEKVTLYGLAVVTDRLVPLSRVGTAAARATAREMFIDHALVGGEWRTFHAFARHNDEAMVAATKLAERTRRLDLLADEQRRAEFFAARIPDNVVSARHFDSWWKGAKRRDPGLLNYPAELLLAREFDEAEFPLAVQQGDITLPLSYEYRPGAHADGITVTIPAAVLGRVQEAPFTWVVPGYWEDLTVAAIKALPKAIRKHVVPAPQTARELLPKLPPWDDIDADSPSFFEVYAGLLAERAGVEVTAADFDCERLPSHLRVVFRIVSERGAVLDEGTDLGELQRALAPASRQAVATAVQAAFAEAGLHMGAGRHDADRHDAGGRDARGRDAGRPGERGRGRKAGTAGPGERGRGKAGTHGRAAGNAGAPTVPQTAGATAPVREQLGLTTWPDCDLPNSLTTTTATGMTIRGYPALVAAGPVQRGSGAQPHGGTSEPPKGRRSSTTSGTNNSAPYSANLRILADAGEQAARHRAGVTRLVALATLLPMGRVTSRWTGNEALALAASPYPNTDQLIYDAHLATTASLLAEAPVNSSPRTAADFQQLVQWVKPRVEDELYRALGDVVEIMQAERELKATIKASNSLALLQVVQDVREQVSDLLYPGFISATTTARLPDVARYLRAARVRLERAPTALAADQAAAWQISQVRDEYEEAARMAEGLPFNWERDEGLVEIRWMIEELRVSLFAQQVGTRGKISAQRIRKKLAALA